MSILRLNKAWIKNNCRFAQASLSDTWVLMNCRFSQYEPEEDIQEDEVLTYEEPTLPQGFSFVETKEEAEKIHDWYKRAISKTSTYVGDLYSHILGRAGIVWRPSGLQSALVGNFVEDIFVVSHFAPRTPIEGVMLLRNVQKSNTPTVMAVPEFQSQLLENIGFRRFTKVLQPFGGEIITKNVMINKAVTKEHIEKLMEYYQEQLAPEQTKIEQVPCEVCGREKGGPLCWFCRREYRVA